MPEPTITCPEAPSGQHDWVNCQSRQGRMVITLCHWCFEVDWDDLNRQVDEGIAKAQRAAFLSLAAELDSPHVTDACWTAAAKMARERAAAIPDPQVEGEPSAEQAHPASSPDRTAAGESTDARPGTEGSEGRTGDVSAAGTLTLPRDEWEAVKRVTALHAAAVERERIRQLAIDRDATAWNAPLDASECSRVDFADLIREMP